MGFKKDDTGKIPEPSFNNCLGVFLPVSTKWGTDQFRSCFYSSEKISRLSIK